MQIEVKGRNVSVTDELREHVEKRFAKVGKQVSELARLEVEVCAGAQPGDRRAAGRRGRRCTSRASTLRAHDASRDLTHAINLSRTSSRARSSATATSAASAARPREPRRAAAPGRPAGSLKAARAARRRRPAVLH